MYALMIAHRFKDTRQYQDAHAWWRVERGNEVMAARHELGFGGYSQLHQVPRTNPLYLALWATRSAPVTRLIRRKQHRAEPQADDAETRSAERWDVVETFTYDSTDALTDALQRPQAEAALKRLGEAHRLRCRRSESLCAEVLAITPDPVQLSEKVTTMLFLRAVEELGREGLQDYWRTEHRELVLSVRDALGYRGYDQCHVASDYDLDSVVAKTGGPIGAPFDGVAVLTYTSGLRFLMGFLSPRAEIANFRLVKDEVGFINDQRSSLVVGKQICFRAHPNNEA
jgi:hypothetical protein